MTDSLGYYRLFIDNELVFEGKNNITNLGRKWLLDRVVGIGSVIPWMTNGSAYIALGEGSGLAIPTLSGLRNELGAGSVSRAPFLTVTRAVDAGSVITGTATFGGSGGKGIISELGLFVTGFDGNIVKTATSDKDSGILFGYRSITERTVNSGAVISLDYSYSTWDK